MTAPLRIATRKSALALWQADIERIQKELAGIQNQLQTMAGKLTQQAEAELTSRGQRLQRARLSFRPPHRQ